jgi:hypothetical protein
MLTSEDIITLKSCEELLTVAMEYAYYFVDVKCPLFKCRPSVIRCEPHRCWICICSVIKYSTDEVSVIDNVRKSCLMTSVRKQRVDRFQISSVIC